MTDTYTALSSTTNLTIHDAFAKAKSVLSKHNNIAASISGGRDSDIMLDMLWRLYPDKRLNYVWFDTGVEYDATKRHVADLEIKYGISIHKEKAVKPIPTCCKEYGQPFLSKFVSEMIGRLQKHGFQWEDEPYDVLAARYPKCKGAVAWWTNHRSETHFGNSQFDIRNNKYLKEFMTQYPPQFKISNLCCKYAKKDVSKQYIKSQGVDLMVTGVRKAEGGVRATAYQNCYTAKTNECSSYRPLFWFKNQDEDEYDDVFGVTHSDCYGKWGFTRTGCVGCPYNRHVTQELAVAEKYEPNRVKAARHIFADSYAYTDAYRKFAAEMKEKEKQNGILAGS